LKGKAGTLNKLAEAHMTEEGLIIKGILIVDNKLYIFTSVETITRVRTD